MLVVLPYENSHVIPGLQRLHSLLYLLQQILHLIYLWLSYCDSGSDLLKSVSDEFNPGGYESNRFQLLKLKQIVLTGIDAIHTTLKLEDQPVASASAVCSLGLFRTSKAARTSSAPTFPMVSLKLFALP